jgi:hypothetical protein
MTTEGGAKYFLYIPVWATTQQPPGSGTSSLSSSSETPSSSEPRDADRELHRDGIKFAEQQHRDGDALVEQSLEFLREHRGHAVVEWRRWQLLRWRWIVEWWRWLLQRRRRDVGRWWNVWRWVQ